MTLVSDDISLLVTRAQTGSHEAFDSLVQRFQDMAVGYAFGIIGDFQLAEDAAQEAFVGAWLDLPRLRDPAAFAGWFRQLVFMRCSRQIRALHRGLVSAESTEVIDPAPSAAEAREESDRRRQLYGALGALSDEERLVTVLFYIGRHSHAEIARFLDLPEATVNNRLRSARKRMEKGILNMAENEFRQHTPSRDNGFSDRVARLSRPTAMDTDQYLYGFVPVNGRDAWALFSASAAGDLSRVRALLDRDPNLVNAQYWYQLPIHMAVREGHADVVQLLLEEGADPGQSRYVYNSWDKLLTVAEERGHRAIKKLLQTAMSESFGYDERFELLATAIRELDRDRIEALLSETPSLIRACDALGNGPIHWAVLTRQLDLIDRFLELGADIDARRVDGCSPMYVATDCGDDQWYRDRDDAERDQWVVVQYLVDHSAELDLSMYCMKGDLDRVKEMVEADPGAVRRLDSTRQSLLQRAARGGHLDIVRHLLEMGADPSAPEDGAPRGAALHTAASRNDLEMAELLLEHGAEPNAERDSYADPLWGVEYDHPDECGPMKDLLRKHGAVPMIPSTEEELAEVIQSTKTVGESLLCEIFGSDSTRIHDLFLKHHKAIVPRIVPGDLWGGGPPAPELLAKLLDCGLDPNRPDWIGRTFLHGAARQGKIEAAEMLLESGADLEAIELEHGGTPLASAARNGNLEIVDFLLQKGANPDAPSGLSWATARAVAERAGNKEILSLFS